VLSGAGIAPGDGILALASSGVHSNGFSLVRKVIETQGWDLGEKLAWAGGTTLADYLLEPTRIYVRALLPTVQEGRIHGLAHITGGGLLENIPRVLPDGCHATVDMRRWELPRVFQMIADGGRIAPEEMARTFNCGVGMAVIVAEDERDAVARALEEAGETVFEIGRVESGQRGCTVTGEGWSATHNA
jgi:phosphoribosylformylglycinamidine cyclo-ligase